MSGFVGAFQLLGGLSMRFTRPADENFLLDLFVAARPWLGWASDDRDFLRTLYEQQYQAMRVGQEERYPEHMDFIIEKTGQAVGRMVIDLGYHDWRVSELHVHPQARSKGIGSELLRSIQMAAARTLMPMTLAVPMMIPEARAFYERLGFRVMQPEPPVLEMAWFPQGHPLAAPVA